MKNTIDITENKSAEAKSAVEHFNRKKNTIRKAVGKILTISDLCDGQEQYSGLTHILDDISEKIDSAVNTLGEQFGTLTY